MVNLRKLEREINKCPFVLIGFKKCFGECNYCYETKKDADYK